MNAETSAATIGGWFAGRIPQGWFVGPPDVTMEDDQAVVVGEVPPPALAPEADAETRAGAEAGAIARFREETRRHRIHIAREAEHAFERNVTWGARCGNTVLRFNTGGGGRRRSEPEPGAGAAAGTVNVSDRQAF